VPVYNLDVNQGKDAFPNGISGVLAGKTMVLGLSTIPFASCLATMTYATRSPATYWTGGADQTETFPTSVNGSMAGSQISWNTGAATDGPNNVYTGTVSVSGILIMFVDAVALTNLALGTSYTVLDMSVANQVISWSPAPLIQNVGGG
jgi:hypothetical protein